METEKINTTELIRRKNNYKSIATKKLTQVASTITELEFDAYQNPDFTSEPILKYNDAIGGLYRSANAITAGFIQLYGKYFKTQKAELDALNDANFILTDIKRLPPSEYRDSDPNISEIEKFVREKDFIFLLEVANAHRLYDLVKKYKRSIPKGLELEQTAVSKLNNLCAGKIGRKLGPTVKKQIQISDSNE